MAQLELISELQFIYMYVNIVLCFALSRNLSCLECAVSVSDSWDRFLERADMIAIH